MYTSACPVMCVCVWMCVCVCMSAHVYVCVCVCVCACVCIMYVFVQKAKVLLWPENVCVCKVYIQLSDQKHFVTFMSIIFDKEIKDSGKVLVLVYFRPIPWAFTSHFVLKRICALFLHIMSYDKYQVVPGLCFSLFTTKENKQEYIKK